MSWDNQNYNDYGGQYPDYYQYGNNQYSQSQQHRQQGRNSPYLGAGGAPPSYYRGGASPNPGGGPASPYSTGPGIDQQQWGGWSGQGGAGVGPGHSNAGPGQAPTVRICSNIIRLKLDILP